MRGRVAFGLLVILAIGALVGWRLDVPGAKEQKPPQQQHPRRQLQMQPVAAPVPLTPWARASIASIASPSPSHAPKPAASTDTPPGLTGPGWRLAFNAGFSGSALDSELWQTCYPWGDSGAGCTNYGNTEYEWYLPGQVQTGDGALSLTASRLPTPGQAQSGAAEEYGCRSGMVTTGGSFNFEYGYVQVQARLPMATGTWPGLWLAASNLNWPPEIDIMEHWDSQPFYGVYLHTSGPTQETHVPAPDLGGWHTYAVSWEPNQLTWYLDGQEVYSTNEYVPAQSMYFVADLAVDDQPTATVGCDGTMQIRSVKIWQHS